MNIARKKRNYDDEEIVDTFNKMGLGTPEEREKFLTLGKPYAPHVEDNSTIELSLSNSSELSTNKGS